MWCSSVLSGGVGLQVQAPLESEIMMQQSSKSRAHYSYDDDAMAISTLTVHENFKKGLYFAQSWG